MGECGKIMSIQHAKFLWEVMRRFARELITPSLNGIKLFASSLIGLIFIPHITRWQLSTFTYYCGAFLYYCCVYTFSIECAGLLIRLNDYHRIFFYSHGLNR